MCPPGATGALRPAWAAWVGFALLLVCGAEGTPLVSVRASLDMTDISHVVSNGLMAYATRWGNESNFIVVDYSGSEPVVTARLDFPDGTCELAYTRLPNGTEIVAVATYTTGLQFIDVTSGGATVIGTFSPSTASLSGVAIAGGYAYTTDKSAAKIYAVSIPSGTPSKVMSFPGFTPCSRVHSAGGLVYVVGNAPDEYAALRVLSVTDPLSPVVSASTDRAGGRYSCPPVVVYPGGSPVYPASYHRFAGYVDILHLKGNVFEAGAPYLFNGGNEKVYHIGLSGDYLYVARGAKGLSVLPLGAGGSWTQSTEFSLGDVRALSVQGDSAFVATVDKLLLCSVPLASPTAAPPTSAPPTLVPTPPPTDPPPTCSTDSLICNPSFEVATQPWPTTATGPNWLYMGNVLGWSASHGTPSIFGGAPGQGLRSAWMWSHSGVGEGIVTKVHLSKDETYRVTMWVVTNHSGTFYVQVVNGLVPAVGNTAQPLVTGSQQTVYESGLVFPEWQEISFDFVARDSFSQLWIYPWLSVKVDSPSGQAELRVDNIRMTLIPKITAEPVAKTAVPMTGAPETPAPPTALPATGVPETPAPPTDPPTTSVPDTALPQRPTTAPPTPSTTALPTTSVPDTRVTHTPMSAMPVTRSPPTSEPTALVTQPPIATALTPIFGQTWVQAPVSTGWPVGAVVVFGVGIAALVAAVGLVISVRRSQRPADDTTELMVVQ